MRHEWGKRSGPTADTCAEKPGGPATAGISRIDGGGEVVLGAKRMSVGELGGREGWTAAWSATLPGRQEINSKPEKAAASANRRKNLG